MTVRTEKRMLRVGQLADLVEAIVILYGDSQALHINTAKVNWAHGELHKYLVALDLIDAVDSPDDLPF